MDKQKARERLQTVVDYIKYSRKLKTRQDFADLTDVNYSALSAALKGNEQYLTRRILEKIAYKLPEINDEWLLDGKGEMLAPALAGPYSPPPAPVEDTSIPSKKDRLQKAVDLVMFSHKFKNKADVATAMQVNRSTLSSAMNDNQGFLTDPFLKKFCNTFPEINIDWLINGEGEMTNSPIFINSGSNNTQVSGYSNRVEEPKTLRQALEEMAAQRELHDRLLTKSQEQIDRLLGIVENMQK